MEKSLEKLPKHIAFIIDGNGRWAKERGLIRSLGHKEGLVTLEKIVKECFFEYGIPIVSVYAFSTENWNRPKKEVDFLMKLFKSYLGKNFMKKYPDVRFNLMGDIAGLPEDIAKRAQDLTEKTKDRDKFIFNIGINYSGQDELVIAMNSIIKEGLKSVDKETIANHLFTKGQPPVDFVVRTSGEQRLSNFMLWQVAYAEFYFPKTYWPAFNSEELHKALLEYQSRDRRFGAIKE